MMNEFIKVSKMLFPVSLLSTVTNLPDTYGIDGFRAAIEVDPTLFESCKDVVDYRDVAEDILESYGVSANFTVPKAQNKPVACSQALLAILKTSATAASLQYKDYVLQEECKTWLALTDPSMTLRPRLKLQLPETEALLSAIEDSECTQQLVDLWSEKVKSKLPIYAIVYAIHKGLDLDDTFLHAPKSSIRGSLCVLRDMSSEPLSVKACRRQNPDLKRMIVCHDGWFAICSGAGCTKFVDPNAYLCVPIPGIEMVVGNALRRYAVFAKGSTASVKAITFNEGKVTATTKLELDLGEPVDFLDCQRDRDDNIVILWGRRNVLTGNAVTQYVAWSEDELMSKNPQVNVLETHKLPPRNVSSTKIDYRDHGNLLALVTTISETEDNGSRTFAVDQKIMFGNHVLESPPARVFHVFGAPGDYVKATQEGIVSRGEKTVLPAETDYKKSTSIAVWYI